MIHNYEYIFKCMDESGALLKCSLIVHRCDETAKWHNEMSYQIYFYSRSFNGADSALLPVTFMLLTLISSRAWDLFHGCSSPDPNNVYTTISMIYSTIVTKKITRQAPIVCWRENGNKLVKRLQWSFIGGKLTSPCVMRATNNGTMMPGIVAAVLVSAISVPA